MRRINKKIKQLLLLFEVPSLSFRIVNISRTDMQQVIFQGATRNNNISDAILRDMECGRLAP